MALEGVEGVAFDQLVGQHAAEQMVGGVQMTLDEARVNRRALGIDLARGCVA